MVMRPSFGCLALALVICLSLAQAFLLPSPMALCPSAAATSAATGRATSVFEQPKPQRYSRVNRLYMGRRAAKNAARKGKSDALKTKIYASYGKKLVMTVKAGGPEPEVNRALAVLIREAKAQGVPTDNVQRAIQRGSSANEADYKEAVYKAYGYGGAGIIINCLTDNTNRATHALYPSLPPPKTGSSANEADYKEAVYEAYGYGGAGIIINCLTDNTNRAKTEINNVIKKSSVKLGTVGSVSYNFERKGRLDLAGVVDEDSVLEAALEADVEEVDTKVNEEEKTTSVWVDPASISGLREVLLGKGVEIKASIMVNVPKMLVDCSDEDFEGNMSVIEALEELDDVDSVEHNVAVDEEEEEE